VDNFENVNVVKKANIYFNGKVTSRTVLFADGSRKTLGIILPGEYEFGTGDHERMEILAGSLKALLPGNSNWYSIGPGQAFDIPANSKFKIAADEVCDYCCSYFKT
jgi:purine/pyrimidine-nucleoside phosphorylase